MEYSLRIVDLELDKLYNDTFVRNNRLSTASDYLDFIIMNILVLEVTTQMMIANVIMPNIISKLDATDAGWIRDFYFVKVYTDATAQYHIESAILLKEVCKKLLYQKYIYFNVLSANVPPEEEVDPDNPPDPVVPDPAPDGDDSVRYVYSNVMQIEPNDLPAIDPDYVGIQQPVVSTNMYALGYPQLPTLPATASGELPLFYKDTYYEALRSYSRTISTNTIQKAFNIRSVSILPA